MTRPPASVGPEPALPPIARRRKLLGFYGASLLGRPAML